MDYGIVVIPIIILLEKASWSFQLNCLPKVESQLGYALDNKYTNRSLIIKDYAECLMECKNDEQCMSLNYHLTKKECEINTQTRESRIVLYKQKANSIYSTNPAYRNPTPVKGMKEFPAKSCLDILVSNESIGTGDYYWIDPGNTGIPIKVFCDMTTDGGGWTIVKRLLLDSALPPRLITDNYRDISLYDSKDNNVFPSGRLMGTFRALIGFQQMHFFCHKKSVGRVVSIITRNDTVGKNVVRFFTDDAYALNNFPVACGSFDRLPEDTAIISQNCALWGRKPTRRDRVNAWGFHDWNVANRLNTRPFTSDGVGNTYGFHKKNNAEVGVCDEGANDPQPYTVGDMWQISVR